MSAERALIVKAVLVIAAGVAVMHLPVRRASAARPLGDCISGCCFCINDTQACADPHQYDTWCISQGCGVVSSCGADDSCSIHQVLLECLA
jgi:hypothetical protein